LIAVKVAPFIKGALPVFFGTTLLIFFLSGKLAASQGLSSSDLEPSSYQSNEKGIIKIKALTHHPLSGRLFAQGGLPVTEAPPPPPQSKPDQGGWIIFNIKRDVQIIGKKPHIEGNFQTPIKPETLIVLLDYTDVTSLVNKTSQGFEYDPVLVLPAGKHTLSVQAIDTNGKNLQMDLPFTTKHTEKFDELFTDNEASLVYEGALKRADTATTIPYSKIEGNLRHTSKIKDQNWEVSFKTNLRYLDQSSPIPPPQKIGLDAANWLLSGKYQKEAASIKADLGDIVINESPYTSQFLARRGGTLAVEYKDFDLRAFNVLSKQVYGLEDGLGISTATADRITGTSAGIKLFNNQVGFRGIYLTGGESGSSFGVSSLSGNKKGEVLGGLMTTDFFKGALKSEFEAGFSRFDSNTEDTLGSRDDKAYRFKLFGNKGLFSYEGLYEYIGTDYEVIGNPSIQKNKQGFSLKGGGNFFNIHNINVAYSQYNDNVQNDNLLPKVYTYQGTLDYTFNKFPQFPMGLNYQRTIQESTQEPAGTIPIKTYTDTVSGRVSYINGPLNLGLQTNYSVKDDQSSANNDTSTLTVTLTPAFNLPSFSIAPSFSLNQTKTPLNDVRVDNFLVGLQLMAKALQNKLSLEMAGTYNVLSANNNSQDGRNVSGNFRISYALGNYLKGLFNPSIGLKGVYTHILDHVNARAGKDELSILLVFTTSIPFSF
jgi:hypothetical protein